MMDYNPATNNWNSFFTNTTSGDLKKGTGFALRVGASADKVTFTGTANAGNLTVSSLGAGFWNCIGNPYTSAIHINSNSNTDNFLTLNGVTKTNIDPAYGIYLWEKPDANNGQAGQFTTISNVSPAYQVQQGQAFLVKMNTGVSSVDFASAIQTHLPALALKSSETQWPTIQLEVLGNGLISSAIIAFNQAMTRGLDPTYDAGLLKGTAVHSVYTKLLDDYGIPFAIQALPDNDFNNLIIPVGLDSKNAAEMLFSAKFINLPPECNVILEDKQFNKFTNLATDSYAVTVEAKSSISNRFFIHTSYKTTGIDPVSSAKLKVYAVLNNEIRIEGIVGEKAIAKLYDIQGRTVFVKNLYAGNINIIRTPNIKNGIYLLHINDNNHMQVFKIPVNE
jgi:trimeric autotransporter adhesin